MVSGDVEDEAELVIVCDDGVGCECEGETLRRGWRGCGKESRVLDLACPPRVSS